MEKKMTKEKLVMIEHCPKLEPLKPNEKSGLFPKNSIFTKTKTYIDRETGQQNEVPAGWRKFNMKGKDIVLIRDTEVSKVDAQILGGEKSQYLESRGKAKAKAKNDNKELTEEEILEAEIKVEEEASKSK